MANIERRTLTASLRSAQGDFALEGYAATYNTLSHNLSNYREKIAPRAFDRSLCDKDDVRCLFNHDSSKVLGRVANGTLQLSSDNRGLKFRCQLDKNQSAHRDLYSAVSRGDISDCSFAFQCPEGGCDFNDRGLLEDGKTPCSIRTLRDLKLLDVSCVTSPAYPSTSVDARTAPQAIDAQIREWNKRHHNTKQVIAEARFRASAYPELALENISRAMRLGYSEDAMNSLRLAAITRQVRQGFAFEAGAPSPRYEQGQIADPTASLRDDDDWDDDEWDLDDCFDADSTNDHRASAVFHRKQAATATDWSSVIKHSLAADAHANAAFSGDADASQRARTASARLKS